METNLPPVDSLLGRLPWFRDLSRDHRTEMLSELTARLVVETSREEFVEVLEHWQQVAHGDAKWSRFGMLRKAGLLEPPDRAA